MNFGCGGREKQRSISKLRKKQNLSIAALCTKFISLTDPACRERFIEAVKDTAEVCRKLGCKTIISQVGQELENVPREEQHASIVAGLKKCLPILRDNGLTLVIEPLNTRKEHPGYYLWQAQEAFQIIDEVGDEHVKVLYDIYHQYTMDDLNVDEILANIGKIGHFHMAGCPGRHEPLVNSKIDYIAILKAIKNAGYQESVGLEYFPVEDGAEGLKVLFEQLKSIDK